jgi:hypothetical protein
LDSHESVKIVFWLGESLGFWVQTGAFILSAFGAIAIIYNNSHQAKKRATIDDDLKLKVLMVLTP